jgi:hypothetical protein
MQYHDIERQNAPLVGTYQNAGMDLPGMKTKRPHTPSSAPAGGVRDPLFLVLFLGNLVAVFFYAFTSGLDEVRKSSSDSDGSISSDTKNILYATLTLCCASVAITALVLGFLMKNAESLIRFTLYFNIAICLVLGGWMLAAGQALVSIIMFLVALLNWCYMRAVQSRIPFASANLKVACAAVKEHFSTVFVSYLVVIMGTAWSAVWMLSAFGVYKAAEADADNASDNDVNTDDSTTTNVSNSYGAAFFFLSISFYWGHEVLKNISHVTTAGAVASWWYDPNVSSVVAGSFCRATTSSLGSIAFGSLIVAVLQVLENMARKGQRDGNMLACIARCIIACFKNMAEYFNRWAFVYVGIYGDSFISSGKAVCALFKNRGWTTIINDNLIQRTLSMLSLAVGLVVGGIGATIGTMDKFDSINNASWILFGIGFVVGLFLTLIMVSVVDSAVATIFVCFAESPQVFEQTHPALYYDLTASWREAHNVMF